MHATPADQFEMPPGRREHCEVLTELGDCYADLGRHADARDCYVRAGAVDPAQPRPHLGLGIVGMQTGRLDDARRAFARAAEVDPDSAEAYGGLAMVHQQQGDYARAFDMYLACLERDVDNLAALLGLFQTSCQMGTFRKIIHFLEVYLDRHPGDVSVLFCLASLYVKEGRLADARRTLADVLTLQPDKPQAAELLREVESRLPHCPEPQRNVAEA